MSDNRRRWYSPVTAPLVSLLLLAIPAFSANASDSYTLFESGQVRPLAMSADGSRVYAANTPDNRVEVFRTTKSGLDHCGSISVGLEPVALAVRNDRELWVVNHLSDSVSVVRLNARACARDGKRSAPGAVVRTILVGDEPRDIVFAGPGRSRAFISTAHRGQNNDRHPQLTTPGVGRADVWVFNSRNVGDGLGGEPLSVITLFTDTPRALAVSPDGKKVYAAGFHTGNRTTTLSHRIVSTNGGLPGPLTNFTGEPQPPTGLIVKNTNGDWLDELGRSWNDFVRFSLPDRDVFVIDAMANPPAPVEGGFFTEVGSTIFNMAVNPVSGAVYVSNTQADNHVRFEGPGIFAGSTNRGRIHRSHISVLKDGQVIPTTTSVVTCCLMKRTITAWHFRWT
jgi:DNA-binding beta-propeller fold protein YncE